MMFICWIARERGSCALWEGGSVNVTVPHGAEAVRYVIIISAVVRGWHHQELVLCLQVCVASESVTACPGEAGLVALRCVFGGILQMWSEQGEQGPHGEHSPGSRSISHWLCSVPSGSAHRTGRGSLDLTAPAPGSLDSGGLQATSSCTGRAEAYAVVWLES